MLSEKFFIQIINLDGSDRRWARMQAQLDATGLPYHRCPAFDGRGKAAKDLPRYSAWRARLWYGNTLTGSEVGCFLSHLEAARRFLETDKPYSLVLEDDAVLPPDFTEVLSAIVVELEKPAQKGWRLVNLARQVKVPRDATPIATVSADGRELCACLDFPSSNAAHLWSRKGAERFGRMGRRISGNCDNTLRSDMAIWGGGYCLNPPLVATAGPSEIGRDRKAAEARRGGRRKRGWFKLRAKWRGEWRTAVGHLRGMLGIR